MRAERRFPAKRLVSDETLTSSELRARGLAREGSSRHRASNVGGTCVALRLCMGRWVFLSMATSSMFAVLATACLEDSTNYGTDSDYLRPVRTSAEDDDDDSAPPKTQTKPKPSSSASAQTPVKPAASTSASASTSSALPPATCDPGKATTKADCQKCCAAKGSSPPSVPAPKPAASCACGGGSKCGALCEGNLCRGDAPNVACGICLLVAKCDPSEAAPSPPPSTGDSCYSACNSKP